MKWLSSPKVRLALIVNGLYFISLFTPPPPYARPRLFAHTNGRRAERPAAKRLAAKAPPAYAPLPRPSGPTQAATHYWKERDQLDVYLTNDLTLIRQLGHTLMLSPTFTAKALAPEPPRSVLMHFVSYSQQQVFDHDTPFVITADGAELWRSGATASPLHSAAYDDDQVVETFGQEIPYDLFLSIISARHVVVELGDDRVELTADHIEALRDMRRRLPQ
ncbi:MAG: hypothetical protein ABW208_04470 [Pyrinomonadaceae bacterium]